MRAIQQEALITDDYHPQFDHEPYVSEEEYWNNYYSLPDISYEWNNGILEEKPMGDYQSSQMYRWFMQLLEEYIKNYPIAKPVVLDIGFRLALPHKVTIRKPDIAVILESNPVGIDADDCTFRGIFDLCIEFLSDSSPRETERDTVVKKSEYSRIGVAEYFILDRKGNETAFYRRNRSGTYSRIIPMSGDVIQSKVLPGFQFRISHLYTRPPLTDIVNDPVYTGFVLKEYQEEHKKTQAERKRADAERKRADEAFAIAEAERVKASEAFAIAEKLAEKLRSLGINPGI